MTRSSYMLDGLTVRGDDVFDQCSACHTLGSLEQFGGRCMQCDAKPCGECGAMKGGDNDATCECDEAAVTCTDCGMTDGSCACAPAACPDCGALEHCDCALRNEPHCAGGCSECLGVRGVA